MGRSSLFTRSKMIRYVKVMEKFAYATIIFGTVGYYFIAKDQEKIEKDSFLSQYTDKYSNQATSTTTTTNNSTTEPNKTI